MLTMAEVENIREMYFNKGFSISRIAREVERDRKTIRNYLLQDDWNKNQKEPVERTSKIDRYKATEVEFHSTILLEELSIFVIKSSH